MDITICFNARAGNILTRKFSLALRGEIIQLALQPWRQIFIKSSFKRAFAKRRHIGQPHAIGR